jgi:hypothetical protein
VHEDAVMTIPVAFAARAALCIVACALTSVPAAQVYKCQDAGGRTVYADAPCASGGKPLRLQDPTTPTAPATSACGQLQDETRRLAAEAKRDAEGGRPVDATRAKRRETLVGEYQRRCVGISRTEP